MKKPDVSPNFTIEDIHKIREYHYELTKDMASEDRFEFYREGSREFKKLMTEQRHIKELAAV